VKIDLPEDSIREIRPKNKGLSILLPISIGVAILALLGYGISFIAIMP